MSNHKTFIPKEHFFTFQKRKGSELPLAFMTPEGSDKAAEKRKETARNWAGGYSWKQHETLPEKVLKNELIEGFKISKSVRRWYTSNVVWRVEDPRGFELEISSDNLANLLFDTKIEGGLIEGKLVWGRHGANNVLLHQNSEPYKEAVKFSEFKRKKKISLRDVQIGNEVTFNRGLRGMYLGYYHIIEQNYENDSIEAAKSKNHAFLIPAPNDGTYQGDKDTILFYSSPKVKEIHSDWTMDELEAFNMVNEKIADKNVRVENGSGSLFSVYGVTRSQDEYHVTGSLDSVDPDDMKQTLLIAKDKHGYYYRIHRHSQSFRTEKPDTEFQLAYQDRLVSVDDFIKTGRLRLRQKNMYGTYGGYGWNRGFSPHGGMSATERTKAAELEWFNPSIVIHFDDPEVKDQRYYIYTNDYSY